MSTMKKTPHPPHRPRIVSATALVITVTLVVLSLSLVWSVVM
jgi:hypothetical protein